MTTPGQHDTAYGAEGHAPVPENQPQYAPRETDVLPEDDRQYPRQTNVLPHGQTRSAPRDVDAAQVADTREASGPAGQHDGPHSGLDADGRLFADDELAGLRARWDSVQAGFVDDPQECVQRADTLVANLLDQLTDGFAQARSRLEEQWARGEQASTEDLRVALKRYRSFFERLLSV
ncbi:hypothetical protein Mycch_0781 [Mycolicibacterium chubuense NBB4]|uniref:Uncharacterized protein n=1 Tax=Mycolicibacterium chubuense (strain NBB4) TaxID=710421 RepID=I4BE91_MYCCN|nr:hypothetical protein [Mycolicibacterium chubuense]AFM15598.1 hypothetical protein Mycch_0781 [Mycolicibacterium chubuense NBB4]